MTLSIRSFSISLLSRLLTTPQRMISVTTVCLEKRAHTWPTKPIPGSPEHLEPYGWAERLFKLTEIRKEMALKGETLKEEPPLLNMVCRILPMYKAIHYEKAMLERYGLGKDTKTYEYVLVKNVPSVNDDLSKINHLIRLQPVRFPMGMPETEDDLRNGILRPNGDFIIRKAIQGQLDDSPPSSVPAVTAEPTELDEELKKRWMNRSYRQTFLNKRWKNHELLQEHFTSHYHYYYNQDKQEYRYKENWRLRNAMKQSLTRRRNPDGTYRQNLTFEADYNTFPWRNY